jgi:hypothetical protein
MRLGSRLVRLRALRFGATGWFGSRIHGFKDLIHGFEDLRIQGLAIHDE